MRNPLIGCLLALLGACSGLEDVHIESTSEALSNVSGRLDAFYNDPANYRVVERDVRSFYPPFRKNGCVAFMSSALRRVGQAVPKGPASLSTGAFSAHLRGQGWRKITVAADLEPGDVVFTVPKSSRATMPAHTYMFHAWEIRGTLAWVIDNQKFRHLRNITRSAGGYSLTPFAYALRAPGQSRNVPAPDVPQCRNDDDCNRGADRSGLVCAAMEHVCIAACHSDLDCAETETCEHILPHWSCQASSDDDVGEPVSDPE